MNRPSETAPQPPVAAPGEPQAVATTAAAEATADAETVAPPQTIAAKAPAADDAAQTQGSAPTKTAGATPAAPAPQTGAEPQADDRNPSNRQQQNAHEPPKGAEVASKAHDIGEAARARLATVEGAPRSAAPGSATPSSADVSAAVQAVVDAAHGGGPVNNAANPGANAAAPALVHAAAPSAPAIHAAANAAVQTGAPVPVSHLAVEIASQALSGKHRFEIRLDPPELGRIDVRLEVDREGRVTSKLVVERPETLDMLRRDASQLERALQQAGLKTSDNSLEFSLRQDAPNRDDDAPQDIARLTVSEDDPQPLEALRQGYGRHLGLGRGIDIRI